MHQADSVRWRCPNQDCRWSMVATVAEPEEPAPRCVCGGLMEKVEGIPTMTYLDFLRGEQDGPRAPDAEEE